MNDDLTKLFKEQDYDEVKEIENLKNYEPKKMTKKEFIREMLRLQEDKKLYQETEI